MALKEEEETDKKFDRDAVLIIDGQKYRMNVYGDARHPDRRTVIGPDYTGELPDSATVRWMGESYKARRTFRYRKGGGSVPGYEWFVES